MVVSKMSQWVTLSLYGLMGLKKIAMVNRDPFSRNNGIV